ncbi:MAG: hypothetical protein LH628_12260 [Microcoleus sp. CAN_BIN18]|nr:hypothetical protein [Microcoleus sp. CAN_BIN18]
MATSAVLAAALPPGRYQRVATPGRLRLSPVPVSTLRVFR